MALQERGYDEKKHYTCASSCIFSVLPATLSFTHSNPSYPHPYSLCSRLEDMAPPSASASELRLLPRRQSPCRWMVRQHVSTQASLSWHILTKRWWWPRRRRNLSREFGEKEQGIGRVERRGKEKNRQKKKKKRERRVGSKNRGGYVAKCLYKNKV